MTQVRTLGQPTRGTTAPNRLRRLDRWIAGTQAARIRAAVDPLVVDLGYGSSPVTTLELAERLNRVRSDVDVVGLEIDPERVAAAAPLRRPGVRFARGGFELPLAGRRPVLVRAMNVLRQYDEVEVGPTWRRIGGALAPGGLLIEGTCDEVGRTASWVAVDAGGIPVSLTVSLRLAGLDRPGHVAERLPKALIHRNVPGERVHAFLTALDDAWDRAAPMAGFGVRQRWLAAARDLRDRGWPVAHAPARWRLGEVTVAWSAVAPAAGPLS